MSETENIQDLDKQYIEEGPSAEFANLLKQENKEAQFLQEASVLTSIVA